METAILKKIIIEIPLVQIAIFAGICTLIALMGRLKLLLACIYGAILYWVFLLNETKFGFSEDASILHTALFILTSIIFIGCGAWVLFVER